ncbi:TPA: hypothetical protein ACH3X2_000281 [Trebouxia sp. C0005]
MGNCWEMRLLCRRGSRSWRKGFSPLRHVARLQQTLTDEGRRDSSLKEKVIVTVQLEKKQHKIKASGKLAGTTIGLDDDLTILQQQRRNAAWPAFKDFRLRGVKAQWWAEKLFVKEGQHFVEHKVLNLWETRGQLGVLICVLLNITGGVNKQAETLAHLSCHNVICLTETGLTEHKRPVACPEHEYYSACRPVRDGKGCHSGGVGVFVSSCVKQSVESAKAAADASYLWLKLRDVAWLS